MKHLFLILLVTCLLVNLTAHSTEKKLDITETSPSYRILKSLSHISKSQAKKNKKMDKMKKKFTDLGKDIKKFILKSLILY